MLLSLGLPNHYAISMFAFSSGRKSAKFIVMTRGLLRVESSKDTLHTLVQYSTHFVANYCAEYVAQYATKSQAQKHDKHSSTDEEAEKGGQNKGEDEDENDGFLPSSDDEEDAPVTGAMEISRSWGLCMHRHGFV